MGDEVFVDIRISEWNELSVKGDISVYKDWFATGDVVKLVEGQYWYYGRKNS
jgi:acyl-coenzyme A synthetase/AMP-(fatty) acid ligase